jgi:hypothetical protein
VPDRPEELRAGDERASAFEIRPQPRHADARPAPPRAEPARGTLSPAASPLALKHNTAEAWQRFLEELARRTRTVADVLERRGRLVDLGGGRALVKLTGLRDDERLVIAEPRTKKTCSAAFAELFGEPIEVVLEDASAVRPGRDDQFTRQVADLFQGRIEDHA